MQSELHDLFGAGDRVVARLTHRVKDDRPALTRFGRYDPPGTALEWDAIAIFRVMDGKIVEEWILRDEAGMVLQLQAAVCTP
jgi:predicted ester cyclase